MELNIVEKLLMNNPIRALVHRHFEARRLLSLGGKTNGGLALETGFIVRGTDQFMEMYAWFTADKPEPDG